MKSIRKHIFLITPMIMILIGIHIFIVLDRVSKKYKSNLDDSYSMLLVSNIEQSSMELKQYIPNIISIKQLDRNMLMDNIISDLNEENKLEIIALLPYFYSLTFDISITQDQINSYKDILMQSPNISRVEVFTSSYIDEYIIFKYTKSILEIMIIFIIVLSMFVIFQHMKYWTYLYKKHMYIMHMFGATRTQRMGMLFKQLFWDALLAAIFVSLLFYYIQGMTLSSGISILIENKENIFKLIDILYTFLATIVLVIISILIINIQYKKA